MNELQKHRGTIEIGGRTITGLRFVEDTHSLARSRDELVILQLDWEQQQENIEQKSMARRARPLIKLKKKTAPNASIHKNKVGSCKLENRSYAFLCQGKGDRRGQPSKNEIKQCLTIDTGHLAKMNKIGKPKRTLIHAKFKLIKSLIASTALYGMSHR